MGLHIAMDTSPAIVNSSFPAVPVNTCVVRACASSSSNTGPNEEKHLEILKR